MFSVPASVLPISIASRLGGEDVHPLPDPWIDLIISLGTSHTDLHPYSGHGHHDLINDVVRITNPCNLLAFQVGEWVD